MVGKTAPIRPIDKHRMEVIKYHIGCLPCLLRGRPDVHTSIEHTTDAGRRVGRNEQHQHTIGLCQWHHFGVCNPGAYVGPSLKERKRFEDVFGSEETLVLLTDWLVHEFDETPWPEHNIPSHVALDARQKWLELRHAANETG